MEQQICRSTTRNLLPRLLQAFISNPLSSAWNPHISRPARLHDDNTPRIALSAAVVKTSPHLRALLTGLIDYAGLFPPAKLPMLDAIRNFASYRTVAEGSILGRYIMPIGRLEEFEAALVLLPPADRSGWRLSVLSSEDAPGDWETINAFNRRHQEVRIVSLEAKATSAARIAEVCRAIPPILELWIEIPAGGDPLPLLAALGSAGRAAKIRTGGVTAEAFPSAREVADFLVGCHRTGVRAKATAGLHHPLSGVYPLSYGNDAPTGPMFGFLNVLLAAALAHTGASPDIVTALLSDGEPANFQCRPQALSWRETAFTADALGATRKNLLCSFGSCSFDEPVKGLQDLGWL